jgi:hypothetical protein
MWFGGGTKQCQDWPEAGNFAPLLAGFKYLYFIIFGKVNFFLLLIC